MRTRFLRPSQINAALGGCLLIALATGLASWALPDGLNGWITSVHAIAGLTTVALLPFKAAGPVRTGMRRRSSSRWLSVGFGIVVLTALEFGIIHATGVSYGVGIWSPLWTHQLFGFATVPLAIMHLVTRPVRPRRQDLERRAVLRLAGLTATATAVHLLHQPLRALLGTTERRGTGSYEIASYNPNDLPTVFWINDRAPADTSADRWELRIQGDPVPIGSLWELAEPLDAVLDCTGGWWSAQLWDAVPLSALITEPSKRSVRVTSATGYQRWYGPGELDAIHLAVGYGGEPLRPGHGAPVRLIVPGRRGPEWVKWVTSIDDDTRPAWLSAPLPLS